jgi:outer membrane receptor protein involved in Fe transport
MKKTLLIILVITMQTFAQDGGKISGRIYDSTTNQILIGANVIVKGTKLGATTDVDGSYFILNVVPGSYEVTASLIGYQTVTQQNVIVNINRTTTVDFYLQETAVDIGREIIITAERPDVVKERTSSSEIVRTDDIQFAPGIRDLTDVLSLSADISDGHFRGGREGEELYTLAGMGIVNPLTAASAFAPIVSAVEEVEVITSGFSAQYGNAQSGVVNITMKEGSKDKWKSRAEFRTRLPGYKHWGNSVFSEVDNPYLQMFNSWEKWLAIDSSRGGVPFWSTIGYGFTTMYKDTVLAAKIAYDLWKLARRDLNRKYDNLWDRSIDININGPLSENSTMFFAAKVDNDWPIIPPSEPDATRQMMGNVVYSLPDGMSLRFSGAYTNRSGHEYRSLGESFYSDFRYWLWDRAVGVSRFDEENLQIGVRFAHAISQATFYEIKINRLTTKHTEGAPVLSPDRFRDDISSVGPGPWIYFETPDYFRLGHMDNRFTDERTTTITFDASLTSQATNSHLLLSGLQMNFYNVNVNNKTGLSSPSQALDEIYKAKPFEWAVYVQDKMEFEGMIANIGLRFDVYNQNVDYYVDRFFPVFGTEMKEAPPVTRLQPRIGISFPVSVNTVFHMNYGSFLQRPSFERTVFSRIYRGSNTAVRLGNPLLKPQDTKSYEVGVTQGLGEGFTVDVSGYYKDVSNLIERAFFFNSRGTGMEFYETYINRDYADIRGFRIALNKRRGWLTGSVKYNYSIATGSSSDPFNASPTVRENPATTRKDDIPNPKDILMDFDRTHNLIMQLNLLSPQNFGPNFLDIYPFERFSIAVKSTIKSGRPYTSPDEKFGLRFNHRAPIEYNTDMKITKQLPRFFKANAQIYFEIFNLLNQKIYSYNTVFRNIINARKFETDKSKLFYYDVEPTFVANQEFLIYGNSPRSIELGLIINL